MWLWITFFPFDLSVFSKCSIIIIREIHNTQYTFSWSTGWSWVRNCECPLLGRFNMDECSGVGRKPWLWASWPCLVIQGCQYSTLWWTFLTCGPLVDHFQARINHFQATSLNGPMSQTLNALEQSKMDCSVDSALPPSTLPSAPLPFPLKDFKEERVSRVLTKVTPLPWSSQTTTLYRSQRALWTYLRQKSSAGHHGSYDAQGLPRHHSQLQTWAQKAAAVSETLLTAEKGREGTSCLHSVHLSCMCWGKREAPFSYHCLPSVS